MEKLTDKSSQIRKKLQFNPVIGLISRLKTVRNAYAKYLLQYTFLRPLLLTASVYVVLQFECKNNDQLWSPKIDFGILQIEVLLHLQELTFQL